MGAHLVPFPSSQGATRACVKHPQHPSRSCSARIIMPPTLTRESGCSDVRLGVRLRRRISFRVSRKAAKVSLRRTVSLPPRTSGGKGGGALSSEARLFGPAIFESKKLRVLHLNDPQHPASAPSGTLTRTYTLTHSDITAKLTLAVAHHINQSQVMGWYQRVLRDEVIAFWKHDCKCPTEALVPGGTCLNGATCRTSLHVHCHISGAHMLLEMIARQRNYIFRRELPVVLEAFRHGDKELFEKYPDLEESQVFVYFNSNIPQFNTQENWGPLRDAAQNGASRATKLEEDAARKHQQPAA